MPGVPLWMLAPASAGFLNDEMGGDHIDLLRGSTAGPGNGHALQRQHES
jgi:hypothetical protein